MKKILLAIVAVLLIMKVTAQEWKERDIEADELRGIEAEHVYYVEADEYLLLMSESDITVYLKSGIFDYGGMDNHVWVTVGLYDTIGNLTEKLKFFGYVTKKQPDLVVMKDYRMRTFSAKHPDNFMVTRIREFLLNEPGVVRFILPKFQTTDLDITIPTIKK